MDGDQEKRASELDSGTILRIAHVEEALPQDKHGTTENKEAQDIDTLSFTVERESGEIRSLHKQIV